MAHHARLAQGEGQEGPYGEEGDQPVGDAAEQDQQQAAGERQGRDADREHEPAVSHGEGAGQEAVGGEQPAEPGEGHETGVGRKAEDRKQAGHRHVVEGTATDDGGGELGQHALIAGPGLVHRPDAVGVGEEADPGQQQAEDAGEDRQGLVRPPGDRWLEGADGVGDRFHPRHRGAARREGAHEEPEGHGRGRRGQAWRGENRPGMPAAGQGVEEAKADQGQEAGDEAIGGQGEEQAGFPHSSQVGDGDQSQHAQTDRQGVGLQRWGGGSQGPDAGGDADGDVEHVVDHQGRGGEQAGPTAKVLLGDSVGAAVGLIGDRRLPVGKVEHRQQQDDRPHHPAERGQACRARRGQHSQGRFRAVGRGSHAVQAHGRDSLEPADPLRLLLAIGEPAPQQQIDELHTQS